MKIADTTISVEVVTTADARERGLSGRNTLPEGKGMLFIFDQEGMWGIWMKDMLFPIDIIWADKDGIIVTIVRGASPDSYPKTFSPTKPALYVLEVPAGFVEKHDIAEGQKVQQN